MFKYKLKLSLITIVAVGITANASLMDSVTSGYNSLKNFQSVFSQNTNPTVQKLITGGLGNGINVNDLFTNSKLPFEIQCKPDIDVSIDELTDMCSSYNQAEKQAGGILKTINNGFSFGGCSVDGNNSNSCRNEDIKKMCGFIKNPNGKTIFGNTSSNVTSKENMLYTGGDIYMKGNICDTGKNSAFGDKVKYGKKTNKEVEAEYLAPSVVSSKNEAGGNGAFWKPGKLGLYETCIKNALNSGARNPEDSCKGEFYALPEDRVAVEEQIATTSKTTLKDSTAGMSKKINDIEKTLKASSYPNCTQVVNGECKDPAYTNNVKKQMDTMIKGEELDKIKKTEEEMATFQEHLKIATQPKYEITYPTQEVLNGLHPEQKADFVVAANKQMHQKALFNSSIQNLTELKKELIEISFKKAQLSSRTFYPQAAMEEANKIMNSGF